MKKYFLFFVLIISFLISCSNDSEDSQPIAQGNLVTKMIVKGESVAWDLKNYNINFIYDDNDKLIRIDREDKVLREFFYSGDLITQMRYYVFWNLSSNPELTSITNFEYDSLGRLIKATTNSQFEYYFNYIDESHVNFEIKIYTWSGNNNLFSTGTVSFDDITKNILNVNRVDYYSYLDNNGLPVPSSTYSYELIYDNKRHPCSGIKGFKELALFNYFSFDKDGFITGFGVTNSLIAEKYENGFIDNQWSFEHGDVFPTVATKLNSDDFRIFFYY